MLFDYVCITYSLDRDELIGFECEIVCFSISIVLLSRNHNKLLRKYRTWIRLTVFCSMLIDLVKEDVFRVNGFVIAIAIDCSIAPVPLLRGLSTLSTGEQTICDMFDIVVVLSSD